MRLGMKNGMLVQSGYTARDYVQDGLYRQVDSIENLGYGQHTDTPTAWRDLIQNDDWNIYGASYRDGMFIKDDASTLPVQVALSQAEVDAFRLSGGTIEFVVVPTSAMASSVCDFSTVGWGGSLSLIRNEYGKIGLGYANTLYDGCTIPDFSFGKTNPPTLFSIVTDGTQTKIYVNGAEVLSTSSKTASDIAYYYNSWNATIGILGSGRSQPAHPEWSFPCVGMGVKEYRLYERPVPAAEIAYNYTVDRERFNLPDAT